MRPSIPLNYANTIPLQYPVVLVHGIVAHDRTTDHNRFWGKIPETLENNGIQVFYGNTDAWGNFESNALLLKYTVEKILLDTKKERVNIIAHSKGGIDARFLIWKHNYSDKTASLTTICAPHHGSEIADLIYKQKAVHTKLSKKALKLFGKLSGDINPNLYEVNHQLTTKKMEEFNKTVAMDSRVYYQSLYTTMDSAFDDLLFFYTYLYIKNVSGANDGVVSEYSARWGDNISKIKGGISHSEILDHKKKKISGVHIPGVYLDLAVELGKKGF
jgi:triacylglycerol esterase/lipase EstA (alpha/beta hydrolase family)